MASIKRDDIHIIGQHSNWSKSGVEKALKEAIYNDVNSWYKFLRLFFISLGVCFTTAGIIFFFAYNWADLHKFFKIGIIEGLIITLTLVVLFSKINENIKNIILTGASILVGVLFAVFGQVYQTGANAYDFFLGWTLFIALWAIISNFAPLWAVFLALINITIILYSQQVAHDWSGVFLNTLLFAINISFLIAFMFFPKVIPNFKVPTWFTNLIALTSIGYATFEISIGIFETFKISFFILILLTAIIYGLGIIYGMKMKRIFYLSTIPFSIIIIISSLLINVSSDAGMFFLISLFVIASVTFLIKFLIDIQKKWANE